jgi:DNA mismatch repair protein MutL
MPIKILSDDVASQIAAGEVVERPASVVKELVENALDAQAKRILIRSENAGQRLIEIQDDGIGIPAEELELAVTRHATSKLETAADLFQVFTLGFRGEALASIGSVSQMILSSRTGASPIGASISVDGGRTGKMKSLGRPVGTTVRVENLFFNVPARKKFLKSDITERRLIDESISRYAMAFPEISIELTQEGKTAIQTTGTGDRREVFASLVGIDLARQMVELLAQEGEIKLTGLISPVAVTRSNRRAIQFYVNGRPVQDVSLSTALLQGYHTMLMAGRFPLAQIFIELPASEVDVNVHPTKAEVRFQNRDQLFGIVQRSIRKALLAYTPVPELRRQLDWNADPQKYGEPVGPLSHGSWFSGEADLAEQTESSLLISQPTAAEPSATPEQTTQELIRIPLLRLIGQVAVAYLIAEGPDGLYLIDQHAAHERILFEKFIAQQSHKIPAQTLLEAVPVELSPSGARIIEPQLELLGQLGFLIEPFGRNTFIVRSLPSLLAGMDAADALRVMVDDFEEDESPLKNEIEARIIARVCKRAAIKAGHVMAKEEQQALLRDLELCDSPRTCPHGRPTMIHLSVDLLERQFGRRGSR